MPTPNYLLPEHKQFVADMQHQGLEPFHHGSQNYWQGPAVKVRVLDHALGVTAVTCQWTREGRDYIVFPEVSR